MKIKRAEYDNLVWKAKKGDAMIAALVRTKRISLADLTWALKESGQNGDDLDVSNPPNDWTAISSPDVPVTVNIKVERESDVHGL